MASVLYISGADFSANAVGKISNALMSQSGSAEDGSITITTSSSQTRFWFPFVPEQGRRYRAVLSVTNGSAELSRSTEFCALRFVPGSSDRTGQDLMIGNSSNIPNPVEYTIEGEVVCNGVYGYVYMVIQWAYNQPANYPLFELNIYDIT